MRILFTVHGYKPAYRVGGPIVSVSALAEGLVRRGHEVTVFTTNANLDQDLDMPLGRPILVNGVRVWYFQHEPIEKTWLGRWDQFSKSVGFLYAPGMRRALRQEVPTMSLVHTHLPFVYPTYAAARAAVVQEKPLFYHQRGVYDPQRLRFRGLKKRMYISAIELPIMRYASTLIALTCAEEKHYRRLRVQSQVRVIPNGIDVDSYRQKADSGVLARWGILADAKVVLFMGRLHPLKGADILVEAFLGIHHRFPGAILVMAGPDEWGMQEKLQEQVQKMGAEGRVLFPGMVQGREKHTLLARANLFCLPSMGEGFSMAILEAMASETAVLISPGCHFPEAERVGAARVAPLNSEVLGRALVDLLGDPNCLREMGEAGRCLVSREFGWDRITAQMEEAYREGVERFAARGNGSR